MENGKNIVSAFVRNALCCPAQERTVCSSSVNTEMQPKSNVREEVPPKSCGRPCATAAQSASCVLFFFSMINAVEIRFC